MKEGKGKPHGNAKLGKGGFGQARNGNNNASKKKKLATSGKNSEGHQEKYVVVITNVENDFAKIHQHCLPSYLGLKEHSSMHTSSGSSVVEMQDGDKPQCTYQLKCRTETRTAQLTVSGAASADVASIFSRPLGKNSSSSGRASTTEPQMSHEVNTSVEEQTPTVVQGTSEEGKVNTTAGHPSSEFKEDLHHQLPSDGLTLEGRIAALQRQSYFGQYLHFDVSIPGREEGAVLHQGHRKRPREDGDNKAHDASVASHNANQKGSNGSGMIKQSTRNQSELVTAVAVVTSAWSTKELRQRLKDLPGFMYLWFLYSRHFRVLFTSAALLFRAKKLLDEFEIEGKVRVNIQLSDHLQRKYEEYLSAENDELAAPTPLLSLGSGVE